MICSYCNKTIDEIKKDKKIDGRWNNEKVMRIHKEYCNERRRFYKNLYNNHIKEICYNVFMCNMDKETWDKIADYFNIPKVSEIDCFITNKKLNFEKPFIVVKTSDISYFTEYYYDEIYSYEDIIDYYTVIQK